MLKYFINDFLQGSINLKYVLSLLLFTLSLHVYSIDDSTRILEISSSQKTLKINRGHLDKLKPGAKATLIMENNGQLVELGRAEVVKVFNGYSYWTMQKPIQVAIKENQVIYLRESLEFWGGLKPPTVSRRTIVGNRRKTELFLTRHEDDYLIQSEINPKQEISTDHKILLDRKELVEKVNEHDQKELVPVSKKTNVENQKFVSDFKNLREHDAHEGQINKTNEKLIDLDQIHSERVYSGSSYQLSKETKLQEKEKIQQIVENKTKQRPDWSDDLSDDEIVNFIQRNGVDFEDKRRLRLMSKKYSMEVTTSLGFKLNDSTDPNQGQASANVKRDFGLSLEYFLSTHFDRLKNFSVEADYKKGNDSALIGNANNSIAAVTFGMNAFYYPFHYPAMVNRNLFFVGTGYRRGSASLQNNFGTSEYAVSVIPILHAGFRYHFENQFGLRVISSFETYNLSSSNINSNVTNTATYQALKLGVGFSYYF